VDGNYGLYNKESGRLLELEIYQTDIDTIALNISKIKALL
jgi:hypothetical protein